MPRTTFFTPLVATAQTSSSVSAAIDLGVDTACELLLDITVATGTTPQLVVSVETSADGLLAWREVGHFAPVTAPSYQWLPFTGCDRFVRIRANVSGTLPSFTFSLTGQTVLVYATPADLSKFALPAGSIDSLDAWTVHAALKAATDMVSASLSESTTLPLSSWGDDIRRAAAIIAGFDLLTTRGVNPDDGADRWIRDRYLDIVGGPQQSGWLDKVARGQLVPIGIIDTTPFQGVADPDISTNEPRGW